MAIVKQPQFENKPDTRGVVGEARSNRVTGRIAGQETFNGNSPSRNSMVSANGSNKRKR